MKPEQFEPKGLEAPGRDYVVNSYCKQRQGATSCKGCQRPLKSWTLCVKYLEKSI